MKTTNKESLALLRVHLDRVRVWLKSHEPDHPDYRLCQEAEIDLLQGIQRYKRKVGEI